MAATDSRAGWTVRSPRVGRTRRLRGSARSSEMLYLDTSCLLKLFLSEPESQEVRRAVAAEPIVVVSSLAELEAEVQLTAGYLGGIFKAAQLRAYRTKLGELRNLEPFSFRELAGSVFGTALRQNRQARKSHCRTLDRLHLAAMEELGCGSLMTHDDAQAAAAAALGRSVLRPGH